MSVRALWSAARDLVLDRLRRRVRRSAYSPSFDLSGYGAESGVAVTRDGERLKIGWPMDDERGQLILDLKAGAPLVASIAFAATEGAEFRRVLEGADPVCFLLVGSRQAPEGRPPSMSIFNVFFDSPANRPFDSYRAAST